jgi:hypothetical protein
VVNKIVMDGTKGTVNATNGIEQCQWDPEAGKIYLNIPGTVSVSGAVLVLDPKTISNPKAAAFVEKVFTIPLDACIGPMGMAIGPHNQILLGCNFAGPNSAIINAHSGAVESVLKGYGGNDEVWFNPGDGHYLLPFCDATCRAGGTGALDERLLVVDSEGFRADQSVDIAPASPARVKSVAADPHQNQVYLPVPANDGTLCGKTLEANGCILVLTTPHDDRRLVQHEREEE